MFLFFIFFKNKSKSAGMIWKHISIFKIKKIVFENVWTILLLFFWKQFSKTWKEK